MLMRVNRYANVNASQCQENDNDNQLQPPPRKMRLSVESRDTSLRILKHFDIFDILVFLAFLTMINSANLRPNELYTVKHNL